MKSPVLIVSNFLSASGGSRGVCEELALHLAASGTPVLTTSNKVDKIPRLIDMLKTTLLARKNYAVAQVDVYSGPAFFWAEAVTLALRCLHKPYVLTLHGGNLPDFAQKHPGRIRRLLASANAVTTPSRFLQDAMSPFRAGIKLLPNALDLKRYPFRPGKNVKPSLIWLRAFHNIYNPTLAPKVLHRLVERFPGICLTMIGPDKRDGSLQRTKELAIQLGVGGRLRFPGGISKSEVPKWLNRGDIFLNTTNVDNTPVSVLEAMACGHCIVSTNVGGLKYLLTDGDDALLVPPNDDEAMSAAIERILTEPELAEKLSRNARAKAAQCDWPVILPQWEDLFRSVENPGSNADPAGRFLVRNA